MTVVVSGILSLLHDNSYRMFDSHVSANELGFYVTERMRQAGLNTEDARIKDEIERRWSMNRPTACVDYPFWYCGPGTSAGPRMYTDICAVRV